MLSVLCRFVAARGRSCCLLSWSDIHGLFSLSRQQQVNIWVLFWYCYPKLNYFVPAIRYRTAFSFHTLQPLQVCPGDSRSERAYEIVLVPVSNKTLNLEVLEVYSETLNWIDSWLAVYISISLSVWACSLPCSTCRIYKCDCKQSLLMDTEESWHSDTFHPTMVLEMKFIWQ